MVPPASSVLQPLQIIGEMRLKVGILGSHDFGRDHLAAAGRVARWCKCAEQGEKYQVKHDFKVPPPRHLQA